jgi:hypothetical protein
LICVGTILRQSWLERTQGLRKRGN